MKLPSPLTTVTPFSKLLAGTLFIAFVFAAFFLGIKYQTMVDLIRYQQSNLVITKSSPTPVDKTASWQNYRNEEYGFEMKYPSDFKEQGDKSSETLLSRKKTDCNIGMYVRKNYKVNQIVSAVKDAKEINIGNHLGYEYFFQEGVSITGIALIQLEQDALNISFDCIGSFQNSPAVNDKKIYVQDSLNQILSTFKFTDQNQVACTEEAKLCPDGKTYVSRSGPNCEFSLCP